MAYCKTDITPLVTHWTYLFLALPHRYIIYDTIYSAELYYVEINLIHAWQYFFYNEKLNA